MILPQLKKQLLQFSRFEKFPTFLVFFILGGSLLWVPPSLSQDIEQIEEEGRIFYQEETLLNGLAPYRTRLLEKGVHWEIEYFGDGFTHFREGQSSKQRYFGILGAELHIDTDPLVGWKDAQVYIFGTWQHGKAFQNIIGSVHDVSSIETKDNLNLMQFWFEQRFMKDRLALLLGLYDIANDFDYREASQLFVNGAFGTGVDLTSSGQLGVPTYPLTALAIRLKAKISDDFYYLGAITDGVPSNPGQPRGTQVLLDQDDGFLIMNEIGYKTIGPHLGLNKVGFGSFIFTQDINDQTKVDNAGRPIRHNGTEGYYLFAEGTLYLESEKSREGLFTFVRLGRPDTDVNPLSWYFDTGLVYAGLLPGRERDILGVGLSILYFNDGFKQSRLAQGQRVEDPEYLVEVTYHIQVRPGLFIQPDIQILLNPADRPDARDALSVGMRFGVFL